MWDSVKTFFTDLFTGDYVWYVVGGLLLIILAITMLVTNKKQK